MDRDGERMEHDGAPMEREGFSRASPLIQIQRQKPAMSPAVAERLHQYAASRVRSAAETRCDFCGNGIDESHGHIVDIPRRALLCVCRPCYLLFTHDGAGALRHRSGGPEQSRGSVRFRAVPTRYALIPELASAADRWDALDLPIGLAFLFRNGATGRTAAFYPSPAGATESELPLESWDALSAAAPLLATLAADVEALLVRRTADNVTALIVPIDVCYELVGLIRVVWRGLQGGDELWRQVDAFFVQAVERASARTV
jgi:hypothetical protein